MKKILGFFCALSLMACTQQEICENSEKITNFSEQSGLETREAQTKFAKILSKAVSNDVELRKFLKEEATKQFDNDYDVFYPLTKDKIVANGKTFREILLSYCNDSKELLEIEQSQQMLNILIPDLTLFWDFNADMWNPIDNDIVVVCRSDENNTMYENGEAVGNIAKGEIPGSPCLVIKDNERMKIVSQTRSGEITYDFADEAFDGSKRKVIPVTRHSYRDDNLEATEDLDKPVPASEFKADIVNAWKEFKDVRDGYQRDYIYYGIKKDNKPGTLNRNIREELYRFRIVPEVYGKIADQEDKDPSLQSTSQKSRYLSNEEILDRVWKDGCFEICFKSYVSSRNNTNNMETTLVFSIRPQDLFSIEKVHVEHRNSTLFRSSKNTYTVQTKYLRSKWYYPNRSKNGGNCVFLNPWDLYDQSVCIFLFVEEVDDSQEITTEKTTLSQYTHKADFSAEGGKKDKYNIKLGYGFSALSSETSTTKIVTKTGSDNLGTLSVRYDAPIIRYQVGSGYQLTDVSSGSIVATVIPRNLLVQ